jgi:hypothetical protein
LLAQIASRAERQAFLALTWHSAAAQSIEGERDRRSRLKKTGSNQ